MNIAVKPNGICANTTELFPLYGKKTGRFGHCGLSRYFENNFLILELFSRWSNKKKKSILMTALYMMLNGK